MSFFEIKSISKVARRYFGGIAICMAVSSISAMTSFADWFKTDDSVWHYTYPNGTIASAGVQQIDGKEYMFDAEGNMLTGWRQTTKGWMYFDNISGAISKGWKLIDGKYYCFDNNFGLLYTSCTTPDGYYVDSNGVWAENVGYANYSYSYQEDDDEGTSTYTNKKANSKKSSKNVRDDEDEDEEELLEEELTDSKLYKLLTDKKYKSSSDPTKNYSSDEILEKMVEYVNILREKKGECELEMDDTLMEAAAIRAEELPDLYSHTRPDETRWVTVLDEVGYEAEYKGENITIQQKTVLHATNAWYNSHGHRKNMLLPEYTKIGVGMYEDHGERYWVQLFSN